MNAAVATVIVAVVAAVGGIVGAVVSAWMNRDKDEADIATKVSQAWDPVFERMDKDLQRAEEQCAKCESKLELVNGRLSRRDEATYNLLDVLDRVITPVLQPTERDVLHEATDGMRRIMREQP